MTDKKVEKVVVVPARAGMSPHQDATPSKFTGGPRASGDEPEEIITGDVMSMWSPRERG